MSEPKNQGEVRTRDISHKRVMSTDGKIIGIIRNIYIDTETGQLLSLIVQPDPSFDTTGYKVENEAITLPFEAVKDIQDFIVVDRYMLRQ
ncbi:MAG TPA: PRC-barrel domain-containing protein [Methanocorpusculum sp.]|nr:PRC-barrel domain-containing protein [Methanocorpusculum sp.]